MLLLRGMRWCWIDVLEMVVVVDLREEWGVIDDVDFMAVRQGDGYALVSYSRQMLWDGIIGN